MFCLAPCGLLTLELTRETSNNSPFVILFAIITSLVTVSRFQLGLYCATDMYGFLGDLVSFPVDWFFLFLFLFFLSPFWWAFRCLLLVKWSKLPGQQSIYLVADELSFHVCILYCFAFSRNFASIQTCRCHFATGSTNNVNLFWSFVDFEFHSVEHILIKKMRWMMMITYIQIHHTVIYVHHLLVTLPHPGGL